jgi:hypothetical protein
MRGGYRIWYDDGSTAENVDHAPSFGVLVVVHLRGDGSIVRLHGRDHYWHRADEGEFYAGDLLGLIDALRNVAAIDWWGAGRTVPTGRFMETLSRAIYDPEFQSDDQSKLSDPSNFTSKPVV